MISSDPTITFNFRLTEEEYYQYNYYTAWADPRRTRYRRNYILKVMFLYAAVAFLYIYAMQPRHYWIDISVFFITGTAYLLLIPFFIKKSVRRRVSNILSRKENHHILEECEVTLSGNGIVDSDTVSESRYNWEAIVHCARTTEGIYLYTNSYHAIVIPRRVLVDAGVEQETEALLSRRLPLDS